jgi:hypothetical protein
MHITQIGEQIETAPDIGAQNLRHVQADVQQQCSDLEERCHVLLVRRRIHDDVAGIAGMHAEIAAKAGVGRGRADIRGGEGRVLTQPGFDLLQTFGHGEPVLCEPRAAYPAHYTG